MESVAHREQQTRERPVVRREVQGRLVERRACLPLVAQDRRRLSARTGGRRPDDGEQARARLLQPGGSLGCGLIEHVPGPREDPELAARRADRDAVGASGGELWVFSGAGDVLYQAAAERTTGLQESRPGLLTVVRPAPAGASGQSTTILSHEGKTGATFDEPPLYFTADDGTLPGLLFTVGDRLHAW